MATAVPSGMRSIAARNAMVTSPVVTPRPSSAGTSRRRIARSGGRASARKTRAPMLSRSQAVPAGPTAPIMGTERAEPSCTDSIAASARPHGGTAVGDGRWFGHDGSRWVFQSPMRVQAPPLLCRRPGVEPVGSLLKVVDDAFAVVDGVGVVVLELGVHAAAPATGRRGYRTASVRRVPRRWRQWRGHPRVGSRRAER